MSCHFHLGCFIHLSYLRQHMRALEIVIPDWWVRVWIHGHGLREWPQLAPAYLSILSSIHPQPPSLRKHNPNITCSLQCLSHLSCSMKHFFTCPGRTNILLDANSTWASLCTCTPCLEITCGQTHVLHSTMYLEGRWIRMYSFLYPCLVAKTCLVSTCWIKNSWSMFSDWDLCFLSFAHG